jgi:hypothetical protein
VGLEEVIGHHGIERHGPSTLEPNVVIPPHYFNIEFSIDGEAFKSSVDWLLSLDTGAHGELSEIDLELKLSRSSYHAFTFLVARQELSFLKRKKEREFRQWIAETNSICRANIIAKRKAEKITGVPAGWMGGITKQDIEEELLSNPEFLIIWNQYQSTVDEINKQEEITEGLVKIILEHASNIRTILYRRAAKGGKEYFNS